MNKICVPISVAELIDKHTILLIKNDEIKDDEKKKIILREMNELVTLITNLNIDEHYIAELKNCNKKIWDMEELIRKKENSKTFDADFIFYARTIYITNDERAKIKQSLNIKYNSFINEVKSYEEYNNNL